jgi:hypothetical protein
MDDAPGHDWNIGMKAVFRMVGLLLVLAVVGVLVRNQLAGPVPRPAAAQVTGRGAPEPGSASTAATPQHQVQQYKQLVDAAMQPPAREAPDEAK